MTIHQSNGIESGDNAGSASQRGRTAPAGAGGVNVGDAEAGDEEEDENDARVSSWSPFIV